MTYWIGRLPATSLLRRDADTYTKSSFWGEMTTGVNRYSQYTRNLYITNSRWESAWIEEYSIWKFMILRHILHCMHILAIRTLRLMMLNHWNRLLRLNGNLSLEDFHFKTGTDVILASIYHPLDERDNKDDTKCGNTIICHIALALCFVSHKGESTYSCCYQWQAAQGGRGRG